MMMSLLAGACTTASRHRTTDEKQTVQCPGSTIDSECLKMARSKCPHLGIISFDGDPRQPSTDSSGRAYVMVQCM